MLDGLSLYQEPLGLGGPVQPDTLHYLHRHADVVSDAIEVVPGVFWGGDFEHVRALTQDGTTSSLDLRFFLGYSGWSPGQLDDEVAAGGWILADADADAVFPSDAAGLWRTVLRRMGGEYAILANFPDDPRLN